MIARTADLMGIDHIGIGSDLCQDQPDSVVEWIYRYARCARLVDGASEVHKMVLSRHYQKRGNEFWDWQVNGADNS